MAVKADFGGNDMYVNSVSVGQANAGGVSNTPVAGVYVGAGAPSFVAPQGSLYLNSTGSSVSTRAFINSTGSTTWVAVTTAS